MMKGFGGWCLALILGLTPVVRVAAQQPPREVAQNQPGAGTQEWPGIVIRQTPDDVTHKAADKVTLQSPLPSQTGQETPGDIQRAAKIKAEVTRRSTSKKTWVKVKLKTGQEVKGRISQVTDTTFTVIGDKTGDRTEIPYNAAASVKGKGLSKGVKIGIIAAAVVAVVVIVAVVSIKNIDPFKHGIFH